jgi:hypothetical protein
MPRNYKTKILRITGPLTRISSALFIYVICFYHVYLTTLSVAWIGRDVEESDIAQIWNTTPLFAWRGRGLSQDGRSLSRDWNPFPPEYKSRNSTNQPLRLALKNWQGFRRKRSWLTRNWEISELWPSLAKIEPGTPETALLNIALWCRT